MYGTKAFFLVICYHSVQLLGSPIPEPDPLDQINLNFPDKSFLKTIPVHVLFDQEGENVRLGQYVKKQESAANGAVIKGQSPPGRPQPPPGSDYKYKRNYLESGIIPPSEDIYTNKNGPGSDYKYKTNYLESGIIPPSEDRYTNKNGPGSDYYRNKYLESGIIPPSEDIHTIKNGHGSDYSYKTKYMESGVIPPSEDSDTNENGHGIRANSEDYALKPEKVEEETLSLPKDADRIIGGNGQAPNRNQASGGKGQENASRKPKPSRRSPRKTKKTITLSIDEDGNVKYI